MRTDYRMWTQEEIELAVRNVFRVPNEELELIVGRSMDGISKKLKTLTTNGKIANYKRHYTKIEDDIIMENYGSIPMKMLSERIYRTPSSIRSRVRLLVGESKHNCISGMMTVVEASVIMGYTVQYVRRIIKNNVTPFINEAGRVEVDMEEFFEWIKNNEQFIRAVGIDEEELYFCPEWYVEKVKELKRKASQETIKKGEWTTSEIALAKLLKSKGNTYREIAEELSRNWRSVKGMFARLRKLENMID